MKNQIHATQVKVYPQLKSKTNLKALVKVVLNDTLVLNGLKIFKGQFGHFISFPSQEPGSPYKVYDVLSFRLRKRLQSDILAEYAKALAAALPSAS